MMMLKMWTLLLLTIMPEILLMVKLMLMYSVFDSVDAANDDPYTSNDVPEGCCCFGGAPFEIMENDIREGVDR